MPRLSPGSQLEFRRIALVPLQLFHLRDAGFDRFYVFLPRHKPAFLPMRCSENPSMLTTSTKTENSSTRS